MTQNKITNNITSIQNIQPAPSQPSRYAISDSQIIKLFKPQHLPKFQLIQLKSCDSLNKRELAHLFINKLEKWNKLSSEDCKQQNIRTQLTSNEFIFSSLKRIVLLPEKQIDEQLQALYKWYKLSARVCLKNKRFKMPKVNKQNQAYDIQKTFNTNAPLLLKQYDKKPFNLKGSREILNQQKQKMQQIQNQFIKKYATIQNNFITNPSINKIKKKDQFKQSEQNHQKLFSHPRHYQKSTNSNLNKKEGKSLRQRILQQQLRRYRQFKQIEQKKQALLKQKSRLFYETSKNFNSGDSQFGYRVSKTSNGNRENKQNRENKESFIDRIQNMSKNRTKTGKLNDKQGDGTCVMPQIAQIINIGLINNLQQVKSRKKNRRK